MEQAAENSSTPMTSEPAKKESSAVQQEAINIINYKLHLNPSSTDFFAKLDNWFVKDDDIYEAAKTLVEMGEIERLKKILEVHPNAGKRVLFNLEVQGTLLQIALRKNQLECFEWLFNHPDGFMRANHAYNAKLFSTSPWCQFLEEAIEDGESKFIDVILTKKTHAFVLSPYGGHHRLEWLTSKFHEKTAHWIHQKGLISDKRLIALLDGYINCFKQWEPDIEQWIAFSAVTKGQYWAAVYLLENNKVGLDAKGVLGRTLLHYACDRTFLPAKYARKDDLYFIKYLIRKKIDWHMVDDRGHTAPQLSFQNHQNLYSWRFLLEDPRKNPFLEKYKEKDPFITNPYVTTDRSIQEIIEKEWVAAVIKAAGPPVPGSNPYTQASIQAGNLAPSSRSQEKPSNEEEPNNDFSSVPNPR